MERLSFKFQSCSMNSSLNNSFKLELVSQNNAKALAVLRYCMLVLLIYVRRCNDHKRSG
jgi:hypothetical protein